MSAKDTNVVKPIRIAKVENVITRGEGERRTLVAGMNVMLVRMKFKKGFVVPTHKHQESAGYVIKGKLKMKIGAKEFTLGQDAAWLHPMGVEHMTEALEDSEVVEVFSPPRPDWIQEGTFVLT